MVKWNDDPIFTRREYLTLKAFQGDATIFEVTEAVSSVAMEHPEWDMNEERTWKEWEDGLTKD